MEVKKNSIIGIVGKSGCGKSTLLDLITGFIQAQTGTIKIDNIELKSNNFLDWQKNISFVSQKNFFLNKSILSNITVNIAPVKAHNLKKVIKLTDLQTVFKKFNHGINTKIGEFGSKLSGGQRQRIAIARAVYKESDTVIFDEATNALDFASEKKIIKNLSKFNKTFIIVSHRVNSLKNCDIIYFLKNGMINDQGTYSDLFKRNNDFRNFVEMSSIK